MSLASRISDLASQIAADIKLRAVYVVYFYDNTNPLVSGVGTMEIPILFPSTLVAVRARVGVAPSGASALFDVNKNGTTIYGTQANRPTITAGSKTAAGGTASVTTFVAGDYLTCDVDTPSSSGRLVLGVALRRTGT